MTEDIRKSYSQKIEEVKSGMLEMGAIATDLIRDSVRALIDRDVELAERVIVADEEIDAMELQVEMKCMRLLALQQPMATDLRVIGGVLKIITDIERLADHTTKISNKAIKLAALPQIKPYVDLPQMAGRVMEMFKLSLDAFVKQDEEMARRIIEMDDAIDDYNHRIFAELLDLMARDPALITPVSHLIVVVQSLERIADHVTNICERIIYVVTGVLPKLN